MMNRFAKDAFKVALREAFDLMTPYSGFCPPSCQDCEPNESLMLLPFEEEIIAERLRAARKEPVTFRQDASGYLVEQDNHICTMLNLSGTCLIYDHRPLDCRSFPVVPRFSLSNDDVAFYLANTYCPLGKTPSLLPDGFIPDVEKMWRLLAPMIELSWKAEYNSKNAKAYTALLPRVATERTQYGEAAHISSSG